MRHSMLVTLAATACLGVLSLAIAADPGDVGFQQKPDDKKPKDKGKPVDKKPRPAQGRLFARAG